MPGGEDAGEADRAVADHDDGAAGTDVGAHGGVPAGAHHVREGQQAGEQVVVGLLGGGDEGAVGVLDADQLGLAAVVAGDVLAVGMGTGLAHLAGVVAGEKASDDELAGLDGGHVRTRRPR